MARRDKRKSKKTERGIQKRLVNALVPHDRNDYLPTLLQTRSLVVISVLLLFLTVFVSVSSSFIMERENFLSAVLPAVLVDLVNLDRSEEGIHGLTVDPRLQAAAQMKANHMAANKYFAHISPDGQEPWDWIRDAGYNFFSAGENLAVHFKDSAEVEQAWMNSPSHRANILNQGFTHIGIATARGHFEGYDTVFVVQMFGSPRVGGIDDGLEVMTRDVVTYVDPESDVRGSFITFVQDDALALSDAGSTGVVAGSSPDVEEYSTWWQRIITKPYSLMQWGYLTIGFILLILLLVSFFSPGRKKNKKRLYRAAVVVGSIAFVALALLPLLFPPVVVAF